MGFVSKDFTKFHGYASDADARLTPWKYRSLVDTMATMLVAGYLNAYIDEMKVGDLVYLVGTDGFGWFRVSSVTTNVTLDAASGGGSAIVTITSAEMLALAAAPKTLVAAPGAGLVARFQSIDLFMDYGTATYVVANAGDDLSVRYTDGAGAIVSQTLQAQGFVDATVDAYLQGQAVDEVGGTLAAHANQPLVLDNIGAAEYTTGDSPVYAKVRYELVTVPF